MRRRTLLAGAGATIGLRAMPSALAQVRDASGGAGAAVHIDVRGAGLKPRRTAALAKWGARGPTGVLTANTCHLEKDGKPLPITAGELHIQRVPPEEWEPAIIQMKAAGLNTVSSYVFWNQIERERSKFDFSGRNDVRTFFTLCQRHGMMAMLRPGPFCNAEFLMGGLPVWLYGLPTVERSNDALYLDLVRSYFAALGRELAGLFWQDGGPIAMIQLENELALAPVDWTRPFLRGASVSGHKGPNGAAFTEHYRRLHTIAKSAGLNAPFYTATGWETSEKLPIDVVMPTLGGYMDLVPAGAKNHKLTVFGHDTDIFDDKVPVGFIEIGYGTPARDAFRPHPSPDHGLTSTMTLFGTSRSLMVGYYMFRGGSNPVNGIDGWTTSNGIFPLVSYDDWAPISEYGEWREAVFRARPLNHFVRAFAPELSRAEPRSPERPVINTDEDRLRVVGRFAGDRGFVFLSNLADVHPLSERRDFSIAVRTCKGEVRLPATGNVTLPSGWFGIWAVNLELGGGVTLRSATAQPVCRMKVGAEQWIVLCQTGKVPVTLGLAAKGVRRVQMRGSPNHGPRTGDMHVLHPIPGRGSVVEITADDGSEIRLLILTEHDAQRMAFFDDMAQPTIAISEAMVTKVGMSISVTSRNLEQLAVSFFPSRNFSAGSSQSDGIFARTTLRAKPTRVGANVRRIGSDKAVVTMPPTAFDGVDEVYMDITFEGDLIRVFDAETGVLVADYMNDGAPWSVSLSRFRKQLSKAGLLLRVEPQAESVKPQSQDGTMTLTAEEKAKTAAILNAIEIKARYSQTIQLGA